MVRRVNIHEWATPRHVGIEGKNCPKKSSPKKCTFAIVDYKRKIMTIAKKKIAIQDTYGERFQYCWGCGPKNREGLHLKSYPIEDGEKCICRFTPSGKYTGGVPDNLFGGMMAVIFDCHGTASAAWFAHHNKGLELTEDTVIGRFVTARLEVDFKKSLPMNEEITVISVAEEVGERKVIVNMEMEAGGVIRGKARMVAVGVKDTM